MIKKKVLLFTLTLILLLLVGCKQINKGTVIDKYLHTMRYHTKYYSLEQLKQYIIWRIVIKDEQGQYGYISIDYPIWNKYQIGDIYLGEGIEE